VKTDVFGLSGFVWRKPHKWLSHRSNSPIPLGLSITFAEQRPSSSVLPMMLPTSRARSRRRSRNTTCRRTSAAG
jgi:hypothetical protein